METLFVVNEYQVLKRIMSYLDYRDLKSASEVNAYWKSIADKVIERNIEGFTVLKQDNEWPNFKIKFQPELIFYLNDCGKAYGVTKGSKELFLDSLVEDNHFILKKSHFLDLANWKFITSVREGGKLVIYHSCHTKVLANRSQLKESLYFIPQSKYFKINVWAINYSNVQCPTGPLMESLKSSAGCIVLTDSHDHNGVKMIKTLFDNFEKGGHDVAMAGGIANALRLRMERSYLPTRGTLITFCGEGLTSCSFVVHKTTDLDADFAQMARVVGPLEDDYVRIAFIFSCVNRFDIVGENETEIFAKHFPEVPLHGFWSLGEYSLGFTPLTNKRRRSTMPHTTQKGNQFFFQEVSTYLFLTYKK